MIYSFHAILLLGFSSIRPQVLLTPFFFRIRVTKAILSVAVRSGPDGEVLFLGLCLAVRRNVVEVGRGCEKVKCSDRLSLDFNIVLLRRFALVGMIFLVLLFQLTAVTDHAFNFIDRAVRTPIVCFTLAGLISNTAEDGGERRIGVVAAYL